MPLNHDQLTEAFGSVYERINAGAPEAPEWSAILKPTGGDASGRKGPLTALAAAVVVLLVVGGVGVLYAPWLRSDTAPASAPVEGVVVVLYLADDIDADQLRLVTETLTTQPVVMDWRYVTKTEAHEEALVQYADNENIIRVLEENPDHLPASIRLLTASVTDATAIQAFAFQMFPAPTSGLTGGAIGRGTLANTPLGISLPVEPIEGFWVLESFNVSGAETAVEPGVNTVTMPWIEIGTALIGNTGCNGFRGSPSAYSFTDGVLMPGEVIVQAVGCDSPVEDAFIGILWDSPDGIEVEFSARGMVWVAGDTRLVFASSPPGILPSR